MDATGLVRLLGEEVLLELDAELLPYRLELLDVLVVLALVLDLGLDAYNSIAQSVQVRVDWDRAPGQP